MTGAGRLGLEPSLPAEIQEKLGGFRHSDTVLVTGDGPRWLTTFPDELDDPEITSKKWLGRLRGRLIRRAAGIE